MIHNLFISHAWKYDDRYQGVIRLLDSDSGFLYKDYSAPKDFPLADPDEPIRKRELMAKLENQIKPISCFILVAGMFVYHHEWVKFEVDLAKKYSKPIVATRRRGQQITPQYVEGVATIPPVGWVAESLISAIKGVCK